jgi:hypothetical protein
MEAQIYRKESRPLAEPPALQPGRKLRSVSYCLSCVECRVVSDDTARGWRSFLTDDEYEPAEVLILCPERIRGVIYETVFASHLEARPIRACSPSGFGAMLAGITQEVRRGDCACVRPARLRDPDHGYALPGARAATRPESAFSRGGVASAPHHGQRLDCRRGGGRTYQVTPPPLDELHYPDAGVQLEAA